MIITVPLLRFHWMRFWDLGVEENPQRPSLENLWGTKVISTTFSFMITLDEILNEGDKLSPMGNCYNRLSLCIKSTLATGTAGFIIIMISSTIRAYPTATMHVTCSNVFACNWNIISLNNRFHFR